MENKFTVRSIQGYLPALFTADKNPKPLLSHMGDFRLQFVECDRQIV